MSSFKKLDAFLKERPAGLFDTIPNPHSYFADWSGSRMHYLHDSMNLIDTVVHERYMTKKTEDYNCALPPILHSASLVFRMSQYLPVKGAERYLSGEGLSPVDLCSHIGSVQSFVVEERDVLTASCRAGQRRIGATLNPVLTDLSDNMKLLLGGKDTFRLIEAQDQLTAIAGTLGSIKKGILQVFSPNPSAPRPEKRAKITPFRVPASCGRPST